MRLWYLLHRRPAKALKALQVAHLKNEFSEDEKCHNLMSWLKWLLCVSKFCDFKFCYFSSWCRRKAAICEPRHEKSCPRGFATS